MATKQHKKKGGKKAEPKASARGRTVEITDAVIERIAKRVEVGNYMETAANMEGVSIPSIRKYLHAGNKALLDIGEGKDPTAELDDTQRARVERSLRYAMRLRKAMAKSEIDDMAFIATSEQWQARAWRLERKNPKKFGKRDVSEHRHSGPGGGAIPVSHIALDPEKLKNMSAEELRVLGIAVTKYEQGSGDDSDGAGAPSG